MNTIKEKKLPIVIASVQWFLTTVFQLDRLFFTYDYENSIYIQVKVLYYIFLLVSWCFVFHVREKVKAGECIFQRGLYFFTVYLVLMMLLLLILWPGTWAWDDLWVLNGIQGYSSLYPWQHIITGYYQDVLLQILPFPGGIILLQNIIISICVAFVVAKLEKCFEIKKINNKFVDTTVKILPFILPPVLMYQFSGYRLGIYVYLELVILVMLICAIKDKQAWSKGYLTLFCFLAVIVATWRTESFFYIPFSCLLILFVKNNIISNNKRIVCVLSLIIGFVALNNLQNNALGNSNYEVMSLLRPCVELVRNADSVEDAELLSDIDKVVSIEVIYGCPGTNGEALYWSTEVVKTGYTDEDYSMFLKAFVKLSLKYPKVVVTERWNLFLQSAGVTGTMLTNVDGAATLFETVIGNGDSIEEIILSKGWIANTPVFKGMRKTFVYALGMKKSDGMPIIALQRVIWNALIPMMILVCAWIQLLVKKKWHEFVIFTAIVMKIPVVVLTQPSNWFMYFLSFYFLGYVYLVYKVLTYWSGRSQTRERKK